MLKGLRSYKNRQLYDALIEFDDLLPDDHWLFLNLAKNNTCISYIDIIELFQITLKHTLWYLNLNSKNLKDI